MFPPLESGPALVMCFFLRELSRSCEIPNCFHVSCEICKRKSVKAMYFLLGFLDFCRWGKPATT